MNAMTKILAAGAVLILAVPAMAQPAQGERGQRGYGADRMFQLLDTNRDGRITWDEAWGVVTERFRAADTDNSGGLTPEQFANLLPRREGRPAPEGRRAERMEQRRAAMFRGLDADRNGVVTLEELRGPLEMRFRMADVNGDGAITRDELPQRAARGGPPAGR